MNIVRLWELGWPGISSRRGRLIECRCYREALAAARGHYREAMLAAGRGYTPEEIEKTPAARAIDTMLIVVDQATREIDLGIAAPERHVLEQLQEVRGRLTEESVDHFVHSQTCDEVITMLLGRRPRRPFDLTRAHVPCHHESAIRDVADDPHHPVSFETSWRTSNVLDLARTIREDWHFDRLPILADALMDAGCADEYILGHCHDPGANHGPGCWIIDGLLAAEIAPESECHAVPEPENDETEAVREGEPGVVFVQLLDRDRWREVPVARARRRQGPPHSAPSRRVRPRVAVPLLPARQAKPPAVASASGAWQTCSVLVGLLLTFLLHHRRSDEPGFKFDYPWQRPPMTLPVARAEPTASWHDIKHSLKLDGAAIRLPPNFLPPTPMSAGERRVSGCAGPLSTQIDTPTEW
jgi:hypothetical protein